MSFSSKSVGPIGAGSSRNGSTSRPATPPKTEHVNGHNNNNNNNHVNNNNNKHGLGLLGSVKSLYATIRRKGGKENKNTGSTSDLSKFDNGVDPPQRPPRKHQVKQKTKRVESAEIETMP